MISQTFEHNSIQILLAKTLSVVTMFTFLNVTTGCDSQSSQASKATTDIIYDTWRQEVLSYFLDIPVSQLPKLVSIND